jgi:hypothetical protein
MLMKASLPLYAAALLCLPVYGQTVNQATRRIAPLLPPPPPRAQPGSAGAQGAAGAVAQPVDPAKVAAQKQKTESDLIKYHRQRAEAGSDNAQYELGIRYLSGNGVERDEKLGREWLSKSAKAGNPKAAKKLEELRPKPNRPRSKPLKPSPLPSPRSESGHPAHFRSCGGEPFRGD